MAYDPPGSRLLPWPHVTTPIRTIALATCDAFGLPYQALMSRQRTAEVALARQVACYVANEQGHPLSLIGRVIGRDHSTVLHGVRRISNAVGDPRVRELLTTVRQRAGLATPPAPGTEEA